MSEKILKILNETWEYIKESEDYENGNGYLYLFALVLMDCFSNGQNKEVRARI